MSVHTTELMFYHLERQPIERVLPQLLEKSRARGWRAVVQGRTEAQIKQLDDQMWTFSEGSFLAHCLGSDPRAPDNPVVLTMAQDNPNGAAVRFLLDGAAIASIAGYQRCVHLFDGTDPEILAAARNAWKTAKTWPAQLTYWQQNDSGQWQQKA